MEFGWISILPPLLAIALALLTQEVLLSLFVAVFVGASIAAGGPIQGFMDTLNKYMVGALTDSWNISILIFCLSIGGLIGIIDKNGGTKGIASLIVDKAKNTKSTLLSTWLLGVLIFFDDYANSLIVGNTMRSITDRQGISREKLAYLVDSTAAPISSMALISTWVGMELGLIQSGLSDLGLEIGAYDVFLRSIPFRFYSILALLFVLVIIFTGKDFGPMLKAEQNAQKALASKQTTSKSEIESTRWYNALVPIALVVIVTLIGLYYNGGGFEGKSLRDAFSNADASVVLLWSSFSGIILAGLMSKLQGVLSIQEISEAFVEGVKSMAVPAMILALAWSLGGVNSELGTANFMVNTIGKSVPNFMIPLIMFLIPAAVAFSTGTSWGTNSIVMPIAIPMAYMAGGEALLIPTIGAVLTGAVLGDHISPISDTTIMSSMASGCDHISHVKTQIPYALTVGGVAVIFGFIPAGFGFNPFISLIAGIVTLWLIVKKFGSVAGKSSKIPNRTPNNSYRQSDSLT